MLVCHRTNSAAIPIVLISISAGATPDHVAHGDGMALDFQNDPTPYDGGDPCTDDRCAPGVGCVSTLPVGTYLINSGW